MLVEFLSGDLRKFSEHNEKQAISSSESRDVARIIGFGRFGLAHYRTLERETFAS